MRRFVWDREGVSGHEAGVALTFGEILPPSWSKGGFKGKEAKRKRRTVCWRCRIELERGKEAVRAGSGLNYLRCKIWLPEAGMIDPIPIDWTCFLIDDNHYYAQFQTRLTIDIFLQSKFNVLRCIVCISIISIILLHKDPNSQPSWCKKTKYRKQNILCRNPSKKNKAPRWMNPLQSIGPKKNLDQMDGQQGRRDRLCRYAGFISSDWYHETWNTQKTSRPYFFKHVLFSGYCHADTC